MEKGLLITTIIVSISIIVLTLFQGKGGGLGSALGNTGAAFQTRRGLEKIIVRTTAVLIGVFFIISVIQLIS